MSRKNIKWLLKELPGLVADGVVTDAVAEKIRVHYEGAGRRLERNRLIAIFGVMGAMLIGGGIILLLAHNWKWMSRPIKTVFAMMPLIGAQVLAGWALFRRGNSFVWRESTGAFLTLAIGSSIALVSQTYHIPGNLADFLFVWSLLALPVIYLMDSNVALLLYFTGITAWSGLEQEQGGHAMLFWPMFALALPQFFREAGRDRYSLRFAYAGWTVCLCLVVATGITMEKIIPGLWIIIYASMFAVMYLSGKKWLADARSVHMNPFQSSGSAGTVFLTLILTFDWAWENIGWQYYRYGARYHEFAALPEYLMVFLLPVAAVVLLVMLSRRGDKSAWPFGVFPLVSIACYSVAALKWGDGVAMAMMNVYMFLLGLGTLVSGISKGSLQSVNGGMGIMSALIVFRFFDEDIGMVLRGLVFIVIGVGFLVTNIHLSRKWGKAGK